MKTKKKHLTAKQSSELLGITVHQFRLIAKKTELDPLDSYQNSYKRVCPLYSRADIAKLKRRKLVREAQLRRQRRQKTIEAAVEEEARITNKVMADRRLAIKTMLEEQKRLANKVSAEQEVRLREEYGSHCNAIPDASHALFELNRFCKHETCSKGQRDSIYDLKTKFVEMLCIKGFLVNVKNHTVRKRLNCFDCEGDGKNESGIADCPYCKGTGLYVDRVLEFVAFGFNVDGANYCWHQPKHLVNWTYDSVSDNRKDTPWTTNGSPKPVSLDSAEISAAMNLLKFAIYGELKADEIKTPA